MKHFFYKIPVVVLVLLTAFNLSANDNYIKLNYGISTNSIDASASLGSITTDDEDQGFMLSGGTMIGDSWGIDLMYYDMGSSKITVTKDDIIKVNNANFSVATAGDINRDLSGAGAGFILASDSGNEFLSLDYYLKLGLHAWDKEGSTTLLDNNSGFNSKYYNEGIGAYAGVGIGFNLLENTSLDLSYDLIGMSSNGDFDNSTNFLSAGIKVKF